jgi:hypothetical protein
MMPSRTTYAEMRIIFLYSKAYMELKWRLRGTLAAICYVGQGIRFVGQDLQRRTILNIYRPERVHFAPPHNNVLILRIYTG